MEAANDAETRPSSHEDPDTPKDQEDHHQECDADRDFRPYLTTEYKSLKTKGDGKC